MKNRAADCTNVGLHQMNSVPDWYTPEDPAARGGFWFAISFLSLGVRSERAPAPRGRGG